MTESYDIEDDNVATVLREALSGVSINRIAALSISALHHGLSCLANNAVPAKNGTVVHTAKIFEGYLDNDEDSWE